MFGTVGEDGCVRLFDMRNLDKFTTLYKDPKARPMLSLRWNKQSPFHLAVMLMGSKQIDVLDVELRGNPSLSCADMPRTSMRWRGHHSINHVHRRR